MSDGDGYNPNPAGKTWNDSMTAIRNSLDKWQATKSGWKCAMSNSYTGVGRNHWSLSMWPVADVGVTLTFEHKDGSPRTISVSKFSTPADNLWAIATGLEQLRLNEKRGLDQLTREFYLMLPAPVPVRDPWEVLGLLPGASPGVINAVYRDLAKGAAGSEATMRELNEARDALLKPAVEAAT